MTTPLLKEIPAIMLIKELERRARVEGFSAFENVQAAKSLAIALDERMFRVRNPNQQELSGLDQPSLMTT